MSKLPTRFQLRPFVEVFLEELFYTVVIHRDLYLRENMHKVQNCAIQCQVFFIRSWIHLTYQKQHRMVLIRLSQLNTGTKAVNVIPMIHSGRKKQKAVVGNDILKSCLDDTLARYIGMELGLAHNEFGSKTHVRI